MSFNAQSLPDLGGIGVMVLPLFAPVHDDSGIPAHTPGTQSESKAFSKDIVVLIADDEPIIAETLTEILNEEGFTAFAVNSGVSAVETARQLRPKVVLADVAMPGLNGIEAAKQIRQFLPQTRIVLFSGHAETAELLTRARNEGHIFEVLVKPLSPTLLVKILKTPPQL